MSEVLKQMSAVGVIPVIAVSDAEKAVPLARALSAGGLPAAEVTFRTAAGEAAIRKIAENCPEILLGAGTVLNLDQCDRAIAAGARFIVSPGYDERLVAHCQERNVTVLPGCTTASDMTRAANAGLRAVKFFPAEQSGGVNFLKALAPVYPQLNFMPTGGVNTKNLQAYLSFDRVTACGGTWMVKGELIEEERWEEITQICKAAVRTMLDFSIRHVGVNCGDEAEAERTAKAFSAVFGWEYCPGEASAFAGTAVECMKRPGLGAKGHIAVGTPDVDRAAYHLARRGVAFEEATRKRDAGGKTTAIYLKDSFCGFAVHLVRK